MFGRLGDVWRNLYFLLLSATADLVLSSGLLRLRLHFLQAVSRGPPLRGVSAELKSSEQWLHRKLVSPKFKLLFS